MPRRSHESAKTTPRPARTVVKDHPPLPEFCYKSLGELCQQVTGLKSLKAWKFKTFSDRLIMQKMVEPFLLPAIEIMIDTVKAFGCFLPEDHLLYQEQWRWVRNVTIHTLVKELESYKLCSGVEAGKLTSQLFHHVVPINEDPLKEGEQGELFPHKGYWRSKECHLMCGGEEEAACPSCTDYLTCNAKSTKAKERRLCNPAHVKVPVSKTDPARIKLTLQGQRLKCSELERELSEMRSEVLKTNTEVDHELSNDFTSILDESDSEITP